MRRRLLWSGFAVALASALIVTTLAGAPDVGTLFSGSSRHGTYSLDITANCHGSCVGASGTADITLTAGVLGVETGTCPYGANDLGVRPIVDGRLTERYRLHLYKKVNVTFAVLARFIGPTRLVGRVVGPAICGGSAQLDLSSKRA